MKREMRRERGDVKRQIVAKKTTKKKTKQEKTKEKQKWGPVSNVVFNLWVISKLGIMSRGKRGLGGWRGKVVVMEECQREEEGICYNWSWGVQSVGKI